MNVHEAKTHLSRLIAAIKWALRKGRPDDMPVSGKNFLQELERALIALLPILPVHTAAIDNLPLLHGDPFDRLLLATSAHEGMTILTHDSALAGYGDTVLVI